MSSARGKIRQRHRAVAEHGDADSSRTSPQTGSAIGTLQCTRDEQFNLAIDLTQDEKTHRTPIVVEATQPIAVTCGTTVQPWDCPDHTAGRRSVREWRRRCRGADGRHRQGRHSEQCVDGGQPRLGKEVSHSLLSLGSRGRVGRAIQDRWSGPPLCRNSALFFVCHKRLSQPQRAAVRP